MDEEVRILAWGGIRWLAGVALGVVLFVGVWRIQNAVLAMGYILVTGGLVASALGRAGRVVARWWSGRAESTSKVKGKAAKGQRKRGK